MFFTSRMIVIALMMLTTKLFKLQTNADEPALVMLAYRSKDPLYVFPFCAKETLSGTDYSIKELPQYTPAYFCPPEKEEGFPTSCLQRKSEKEPPTCKKEVQLDLLKESIPKYCGFKEQDSNNYVYYYTFGYELCDSYLDEITGNRSFTARFIELFEVCYDHKENRPRHINYKINTPNFLYYKTLRKEMEQLRNIKLSTSDFDIEKLRDRNEQIKKYYDSMKQNPDYKGKDSVELVQVVSPKHMAFPIWQKSLYHYVNVQPMRKHLIELLDRINEYIVQKAIPLFGSISIKTGFRYEEGSPMPTLWWKLLTDENKKKGMLIFIHNIGSSAQTSLIKPICKQSECDSYGWQDLILDDEKHFAYCCKPNTYTELHDFSTQLNLQPLKLKKKEKNDLDMADNKFELAEKHCENNKKRFNVLHMLSGLCGGNDC